MVDSNLILAADTTADRVKRAEGVSPLSVDTLGQLRTLPGIEKLPDQEKVLSKAVNSNVDFDVKNASRVVVRIANNSFTTIVWGEIDVRAGVGDILTPPYPFVRVDNGYIGTKLVFNSDNTLTGKSQYPALIIDTTGISTLNFRTNLGLTQDVSIKVISSPVGMAAPTSTRISGPVTIDSMPAVILGGAPTVGINSLASTLKFPLADNTIVQTAPFAPATQNWVSAASTNASIRRSSPDTLTEVTVSNPTGTAMYLKVYNKATAPTVGTDVPVMTIPMPANSFAAYDFGASGKYFASGIATAITAGPLATDTVAAAAGGQISMSFRGQFPWSP